MLPTLIQWNGDAHPGDGLAESGCSLQALELRHPEAARIEALFDRLRLDAPVLLREGASAIVARVATPRGEVELA